MKNKDSTLAQRMLEARRSGYSFRIFFRWNALRYVSMIVLVIAAFAIAASLPLMLYTTIAVVGVLIVREVFSIKAQQRRWRFYDKVTDWEKVEKIANEPN